MYEIRKMEEKDCDAMYELEQICFSGTSAWSYQDIRNILNYSTNLYYVCLKEGKLVGYVGLMMAADEGNITNIAVNPQSRREGIADALLSKILKESKKNKINQIFLEVRKSNAPAIALYEKYGFSYLGCRKNYYDDPREDANIMCVIL